MGNLNCTIRSGQGCIKVYVQRSLLIQTQVGSAIDNLNAYALLLAHGLRSKAQNPTLPTTTRSRTKHSALVYSEVVARFSFEGKANACCYIRS